jgi:hypothetical protein
LRDKKHPESEREKGKRKGGEGSAVRGSEPHPKYLGAALGTPGKPARDTFKGRNPALEDGSRGERKKGKAEEAPVRNGGHFRGVLIRAKARESARQQAEERIADERAAKSESPTAFFRLHLSVDSQQAAAGNRIERNLRLRSRILQELVLYELDLAGDSCAGPHLFFQASKCVQNGCVVSVVDVSDRLQGLVGVFPGEIHPYLAGVMHLSFPRTRAEHLGV